MPLNPDVKVLKAAVSFATDTAANWATEDPIVLLGMPTLDTTNGIVKIGDGVSRYSELPVRIDATLTQAQRTMLDNVNAANGVVQLSGDGKITMDMLPSGVVSGAIKFVADIAARDALVGDAKNGLIFVIDATADATVDTGSAQYVWHEDTTLWEKVGERESLDFDHTPYFHMTNNTLDDVLDGTNFVRMTPEERTQLATLVEDAVLYTDSIFIEGPDAAELDAMSVA